MAFAPITPFPGMFPGFSPLSPFGPWIPSATVFNTGAVAGSSSYSSAGESLPPLRTWTPLSQALKVKTDKALPLATHYDELVRELGKRDPQLVAVIAPLKDVPGVTFRVTQVQMATTTGNVMVDRVAFSSNPKATTGGPAPDAPAGNGVSLDFAALGVTLVLDQVLASQHIAPYKRGALMVGTYALANRLVTGNWAGGQGMLEGWARFNFLNTATSSVLEVLGVSDPQVRAYASGGISLATMAAPYFFGGKSAVLETVGTAAEERTLGALAPKFLGKALWVVQVLDLGGGIAEDIVWDPYDNRNAIMRNFERDEMRDRAPWGLKWTTNFALVRWPMRWFGSSHEDAEQKTEELISNEIAPELNSLAAQAENQLLISAAHAVASAQLEMVDPCLTEVAEAEADPSFHVKTRCTIALSDQLLADRQKALTQAGIFPENGEKTLGAPDWNDNPWDNSDPWGQNDESLRRQFWEYLARWTEVYFQPDLQIGEFRSFEDAYQWNSTVAGVEAAAPWNALTDIVDENGRITDYIKFGAYLKEPVLKYCDRTADLVQDNLLTIADSCFSPSDGSFDMEKYERLVAEYYQAPQFQPGLAQFYDLLVVDSVNGGASRGQAIVSAFDVHGKIKDRDSAVLFLMKGLSERRQRNEGEFKEALKASGLNPDVMMPQDPASNMVVLKTDALTPDIERSIREKGGDKLAASLLNYPNQYDALYHALLSPLSEEWVDAYVRGNIDPATGLARPTGDDSVAVN